MAQENTLGTPDLAETKGAQSQLIGISAAALTKCQSTDVLCTLSKAFAKSNKIRSTCW